jgi:hypothetical protein
MFGGALLAIALGVANGLIGTAPSGVRATVALDQQTGQAQLRLDPPSFAQDPSWLVVTSWRGGTLHVDHLRRIGDGRYRTTEPMPVSGSGKTLLRLHDGRAMLAIPVYMPTHAALGLPALTAGPQFTREGQLEWQVLQWETKLGIPPWLWVLVSLVVLACSVMLALSLAWVRSASRARCRSAGPATDGAGRQARRRNGMTTGATELVLAGHPIITAVPLFVPTFAVAAIVCRDRRRNPHDEDRDP